MTISTLNPAARPWRIVAENHPRRLRWQRVQQSTLFVGLCALLIFGPLALGVVQYWSVAAFELGACCLLGIWLLGQSATHPSVVRPSPLFAPAMMYAALVALQVAFHRTAGESASLAEAWLYLAYAILLFLGVQLLHPLRVERFARVLAAFGFVYALFAITQGLSSGGKIFWILKPRSGGVYGSYVNHNHYAGLVELLFPFLLVRALDPVLDLGKRIVLVFASVLTVASVFLAGSRGGLVSLTVEIVLLSTLWMRRYGKKPTLLAAAGLALVTTGLLASISPATVTDHMFSLRDASRLLIYRDSMAMFRAHPFLGSGLGTFPLVFPHYRAFDDGFFINHAHNDYLELALDTGLAGMVLAGWFLLRLFRSGLGNAWHEKFSRSTRISAAALTGCTGFLIHGLTDFNFHIPANAALFFVVCAVATAGAENEPRIPAYALAGPVGEIARPKRPPGGWEQERAALQVKRAG